MKLKIILLMTVSISLILLKDSFAQEPNILWKMNFGSNIGNDIGRSVLESEDGNIVLVGYTESSIILNKGFDIWMIKTDSNGNILWSKTYGGDNDDYGWSIQFTSDMGYLIAGSTSSFGAGGFDYYVIKTNSVGDTLWTRTYGGINDDFCWSVEKTIDGGYLLAGEKDAWPVDADVYLIKIDSLGNKLWEKNYGDDMNDQRAFHIELLSNGEYILAGSTDCNGYAGCNGWILKLNSFGDTLWTKTFGSTNGSDNFESITKASDGGYCAIGKLFMGGENWDLYLLKTDSLGNLLWSKNYDYNLHHEGDVGYSIAQLNDGGLIMCGAGTWDVDNCWILRTNSLGDTIWTTVIKPYTNIPTYEYWSSGYSIIQALNGDYILTGMQRQISFEQQVLLAKIASDIIPVELTSFTANVTQNSVSLNWQTATETNNSGFEIERSEMSNVKGQTDWQVVGFVPGFGTTTEPKSYSFIDENVSEGIYQYRLKQIDFDGTFEYSQIVEVEIPSPTEFSLEQNYPNPFNPSTNIKYTISSRQFVTLKIFNSLGEEIETLVNEFQDAGVHSKLYIVNSTLPSGVYYYQLRVYPVGGAGGFVETKKMILMR